MRFAVTFFVDVIAAYGFAYKFMVVNYAEQQLENDQKSPNTYELSPCCRSSGQDESVFGDELFE